MTLQQLEYIVALDRYRHFVKAADACFVSQPTLTLQIQKLESEMNTIIFDRSKKPIAPTKVGEVFIEKARQILRDTQTLKDFINKEHDELAGDFRIGVIPTVAPYLMPLFVKKFVQENPNINLTIREVESDQIMKDLKNDQLDIGIMSTPLDDKSLREIPLYHEPFLLYVSELNPLYMAKSISQEDLPKKGLWLLDQGHCLRNQVLKVCEQKSKAEVQNLHYESGSIETLKNLVKHDMGFTLVPELATLENPADPRLKRFNHPEPVREIALVVHKNFSREGVLLSLKNGILKELPDRLTKAKAANRVPWR